MPLGESLLGFCVALAGVGIGQLMMGRKDHGLPLAAQWGLSGALGLGLLGTLMFLVGLFSARAACGFGYAALFVGATCSAPLLKRTMQSPKPSGAARALLLVIGLFFLIRLPAALAPSDASDWDSISHQMAMAKLWLQHGKVDYIPFMHQSNIPGTLNMLYMLGLELGGQVAAKTIAFGFPVFAALTVGGLASMRYGKNAGLWAALALMVTPVVLSEVGTAYVDIAHGLFTGMAILLAVFAWTADRRLQTGEQSPAFSPQSAILLAGLCLGFSMGTKYTGIQAAGAIGIVLGVCWLLHRPRSGNGRAVLAAIALALLVAAPWYVRNYVNTGNPVYPFFYSVFGGRNWSQENAAAYAEEQRSFGIGQRYAEGGAYMGKDPKAFPGSVTALALQPDKQINQGTPWGAIGPLFVLGLLWWPLAGRPRSGASTQWKGGGRGGEVAISSQDETAISTLPLGGGSEVLIILIVLVSLVSWFYLTQQSRYIIGLMVPAAFLLGGAVERARWGWLAALGIGLQAVYSLWLFAYPGISPLQDQVAYLASRGSSSSLQNGDYLKGRFSFWEATQDLNGLAKENKVKVALYDEPRGFYLNVDYFWANPGHSRMIEYENLHTPEEFVGELKRLGTTHVYMNFAFLGQQGWELRAQFSPGYFSETLGVDHVQDFRRLLVEGWRKGLLKLVKAYDAPANGPPRAVLLEISR